MVCLLWPDLNEVCSLGRPTFDTPRALPALQRSCPSKQTLLIWLIDFWFDARNPWSLMSNGWSHQLETYFFGTSSKWECVQPLQTTAMVSSFDSIPCSLGECETNICPREGEAGESSLVVESPMNWVKHSQDLTSNDTKDLASLFAELFLPTWSMMIYGLHLERPDTEPKRPTSAVRPLSARQPFACKNFWDFWRFLKMFAASPASLQLLSWVRLDGWSAPPVSSGIAEVGSLECECHETSKKCRDQTEYKLSICLSEWVIFAKGKKTAEISKC